MGCFLRASWSCRRTVLEYEAEERPQHTRREGLAGRRQRGSSARFSLEGEAPAAADLIHLAPPKNPPSETGSHFDMVVEDPRKRSSRPGVHKNLTTLRQLVECFHSRPFFFFGFPPLFHVYVRIGQTLNAVPPEDGRSWDQVIERRCHVQVCRGTGDPPVRIRMRYVRGRAPSWFPVYSHVSSFSSYFYFLTWRETQARNMTPSAKDGQALSPSTLSRVSPGP